MERRADWPKARLPLVFTAFHHGLKQQGSPREVDPTCPPRLGHPSLQQHEIKQTSFLYALLSLIYSVIATEDRLRYIIHPLLSPPQSDVVQESCRSTFQHLLPSVETLVCCLGRSGAGPICLYPVLCRVTFHVE